MKIFKKIGSTLVDMVETLVVAGAIFAIIYLFLFQPHQVVGDSMMPNFQNNEYILTDKISYRFQPPKKGEVIVFKAPTNIERDYIKRIIAEPKETIKVEDGRLFINGQVLEEGYIPNGVKTYPGQYIKEGVEYQIPPDTYFVLGDNRVNSSDSREWGFVKKTDIIGKSFLVYWPLQSFRLAKPGKSF